MYHLYIVKYLVHMKNIESLEISYFLHIICLHDPLKPLDLYNDFTNLQIFVIHFQHICDVEWTMFSTTCLLKHLCIDVACGGHQDHVTAQFCCHKGSISYLSTWEQEKILRTKSIWAKVVDLQWYDKCSPSHFQLFRFFFCLLVKKVKECRENLILIMTWWTNQAHLNMGWMQTLIDIKSKTLCRNFIELEITQLVRK